MVIEWSVLIGVVGLVVAIVGGIIARDRAIVKMIHNNSDEASKAIKEGDDTLHERINRTRDEMHDQFVRRADLDGHLSRIEKGVTDLRAEMQTERRETNSRLDAVLQAVAGKK